MEALKTLDRNNNVTQALVPGQIDNQEKQAACELAKNESPIQTARPPVCSALERIPVETYQPMKRDCTLPASQGSATYDPHNIGLSAKENC